MKKAKLIEHGSSTKMESVVPAAPGFPVGGYTLVFGARSARKSTWVEHLVARWSCGEAEGVWKGQPVATLMISVEDDWKSMTLPRLTAMGADPALVFSMARGPGRRALRFPRDWSLVMDRVRQLRKNGHPLKIVVVGSRKTHDRVSERAESRKG